jgi:hypothetical protein
MKSVLRLIVYVPLGLLILFFSEANRQPVKIFLDPFAGSNAPDPGPTVESPLFLLVLACVAIGVVAGGISSWLGHGHVRRAAKDARVDAKKARSEIEQLRQQAMSSLPSDPRDGLPGR